MGPFGSSALGADVRDCLKRLEAARTTITYLADSVDRQATKYPPDIMGPLNGEMGTYVIQRAHPFSPPL